MTTQRVRIASRNVQKLPGHSRLRHVGLSQWDE